MIIKYLASFSSKLNEHISKDITDEYTAYVNEHKQYVAAALDWLKENCPEACSRVNLYTIADRIAVHDASKFSKDEFEPYAQKWFGDGKKTLAYQAAWEHHWKNNDHHPEYWGGEDMSDDAIFEMICDWMSFGLKSDTPDEIISFYEEKAKNDPEKNLSENTKIKIEIILDEVKNLLN